MTAMWDYEYFDNGYSFIDILYPPFVRGSNKAYRPIIFKRKAWERRWRKRL